MKDRGPVITPKKFVNDPAAVSAELLMKEHYLIGREAFDKKYEGKEITVEGQVAITTPDFIDGNAYLYGFTQKTYSGNSRFLPKDVRKSEGALLLSVVYRLPRHQPPKTSPSTISNLKEGQWVRARGKIRRHVLDIVLAEAELLAIGLDPKTEQQMGIVLNKTEFKQRAERAEAICKKLNSLKASADVNADTLNCTITPTVLLKSENLTPDGGIKPDVYSLLKQLRPLYLIYDGFANSVEQTIGDRGLKQVSDLDQVERLSLRIPEKDNRRMTIDGLTSLSRLTRLRHLSIEAPVSFDDRQIPSTKGIIPFGNLTKLESLDLTGIALRKEDAGFLPKLVNLQVLKLEGKSLTDKCLPDWKLFPQLRELYLTKTSVTSAGLLAIVECKELRYLTLNDSPVDDSLASVLGKIAYLHFVKMRRTRIGDRGLTSLKGHRFLNHIEIDETGVGNDVLSALATITSLKSISIKKTNVTDSGLIPFHQGTSSIKIYCSEDKISEGARKQLMDKRPAAEVRRS